MQNDYQIHKGFKNPTLTGRIMERNHSGFALLSLIVVLGAIITAGCGEPEITTRWRDREISIDGADTEWGNYIQYYDEKTRVIVCMFSDNSDLFIKISSPNRIMEGQFMRLGLTVWFDPTGGKKKTFGIHYPLGMHDRGAFVPARRANESDEGFEKMIENAQNELEIIGSAQKKPIKMALADAELTGIDCKLGMSKGVLIYELKVPLTRNEQHPYAAGSEAGKTMGIGFETGKLDGENMKRSIPRERDSRGDDTMEGFSGGLGRTGSRGGRSGGRGMGGRMGLISEPLNLWVKATLALEP